MVTTNARSQAVLSRSTAAGRATVPAVRSALYTAADRKEARLNGFLCSFLPTQTAKPTSVSLVPQGSTKADENCKPQSSHSLQLYPKGREAVKS